MGLVGQWPEYQAQGPVVNGCPRCVSGILSAVLTSAVMFWSMWGWSVSGLNTKPKDQWSMAALGVLVGFCLDTVLTSAVMIWSI